MIRADSRREYEVFFFNDTATTEIYTLSLHDALPIFQALDVLIGFVPDEVGGVYLLEDVRVIQEPPRMTDRKSTRLNSSHANISYAVFCLKKKTTYFCILLS